MRFTNLRGGVYKGRMVFPTPFSHVISGMEIKFAGARRSLHSPFDIAAEIETAQSFPRVVAAVNPRSERFSRRNRMMQETVGETHKNWTSSDRRIEDMKKFLYDLVKCSMTTTRVQLVNKGSENSRRLVNCPRMISKLSVMAIIVWALLVQAVEIATAQARTPCPGIFAYVRDPNTGENEGRIEIRDVPRGIALHMNVDLSIAIVLPTAYVGQLELATSKNEAVRAIQQGRSLIYRLRFPVQSPLPFVARITFNNQVYCSGSRAIGRVVTAITLEHTLFPPGVAQTMVNPPTRPPIIPPTYPNLVVNGDQKPVASSNVYDIPTPVSNFDGEATSNTNYPAVSTSSTAPVSSTVHNESSERESGEFSDCGRPMGQEFNPLVSKGERTDPGQWPWLVAIFVSRIKLEFQCAGSLITNRHVLTAAHCLKIGKGPALPTSTLLAVLGRYRLRNWAEKSSVTYEVADFKLHEDYGITGSQYDSDIAVITLMEKVTFTKFILPICLWSGPPQIEPIIGQTGIIVGWGRDENGSPVTIEPRMTRQPIVSQEQCLRSNADFSQITSKRTFCAGLKDGSGPCNGDSGGGFVIYNPQIQRYHLRGIVSLSLFDRDTGACDLSEFIVYTDAAQYADWIKAQIAS